MISKSLLLHLLLDIESSKTKIIVVIFVVLGHVLKVLDHDAQEQVFGLDVLKRPVKGVVVEHSDQVEHKERGLIHHRLNEAISMLYA